MGEVILITRHATAESAVEEMRHETFGFLMKPYLAEGLRGYEKKHKAKGSFYL
ncbi:MAG: hypothetical protein N2260_03920 [Syntrophobacterales bacterium]|nr:hypothetical protein [Syntrophobacterales bacterium]